jgi:hypothetical protein
VKEGFFKLRCPLGSPKLGLCRCDMFMHLGCPVGSLKLRCVDVESGLRWLRCGTCTYCIFWIVFLGGDLALGILRPKNILWWMEKPCLNLPKIFGIHLSLGGVACFGFGAFHVKGFYGPRID